MAAKPSLLRTLLTPDAPLAQDAAWLRAGPTADRFFQDEQTRAIQQHIADSLLNGLVASWFTVDPGSASLSPGDAFCLAGSTFGVTVRDANSSALASAGMVSGVALTAAAPGGRVRGALSGCIPPAITGLAAGAARPVRVTSTRAQAVSALGASDFTLGTCDTQGNLWLAPIPPTVIAAGTPAAIYINVKAAPYSAVGDGAADDTAAITSAIAAANAAGGGIVFFPPGVYLFGGLITLATAGVVLQGAGKSVSVIRQTSTTSYLLNITASRCGLRDLQFDGNFKTTAAVLLLSAQTSFKAQDIWIQHSTNSSSDLVLFGGAATNFRFVDCLIHQDLVTSTNRVASCLRIQVAGCVGVIEDTFLGGAAYGCEYKDGSSSLEDITWDNLTTAMVRVSATCFPFYMRGVNPGSPGINAAELFKQIATGSATLLLHEPITIENCRPQTSGTYAIEWTAQQPLHLIDNIFNAAVMVAPDATNGTEMLTADGNSFTSAGINYVDSIGNPLGATPQLVTRDAYTA